MRKFLFLFLFTMILSASCTLFSPKIFNVKYVKNIPTADYAYGVSVKDSYAFISDYTEGVIIVNINTGERVSSINSIFWARNSSPSGDYLFIADRASGLVICDISAMPATATVSSINPEGYEEAVIVRDSIAFLASDFGGVNIVNVANKSSPVVLSNISYSVSTAENIALKDSFLIIADYDKGIEIYNISDLENPVFCSSESIEGNPNDLALSDNFLYVSTRYSGIFSYDISDISSPKRIDNFSLPSQSWGIFYRDGYLFSAYGMSGLCSIETENGYFVRTILEDTDSWAYDVCADDKHIFIADGLGGLNIYEYSIP